jgi:hypothetical protein
MNALHSFDVFVTDFSDETQFEIRIVEVFMLVRLSY